MSTGLNNLNKRLQYRGGISNSRLEKDKLHSLKKALWDSYQSETAILDDNREFKCLINKDKQKPDYDNKIISIPYQDRCLNSDDTEEVETNLHCGDVFTWKETNTHWLVYMQYIEETAYFRADIRKCLNQIEINGKKYWVYLRGPVETSIKWKQKAGIEWNDLNYSMVMLVTKDDNTMDYFHRFTKIKITEPNLKSKKTWEVVGKNEYHGDGIIQIFLDEDFENSIQDAAEEEKKKEEALKPVPTPTTGVRIEGPAEVVTFDTVTYKACDFEALGTWYIVEGDKEKPIAKDKTEVTFDIAKTKGSFIVKYKTNTQVAQLDVLIKPF